jgi:sulfur-oxidizing protein SoxY
MTAPVDRRSVLTGAAALAAAGTLGARPVRAQTASAGTVMAAALRPMFGDRPIKPGKVVLKLPVVAENGSSVQVSVGMDGPELPKRIVLMAPANPQPLATEIRFGPRAARADVTTRLRLARSQTIVAAAEMRDGSIWAASAEVTITSGACIELGE